jgi:hypothetical protein
MARRKLEPATNPAFGGMTLPTELLPRFRDLRSPTPLLLKRKAVEKPARALQVLEIPLTLLRLAACREFFMMHKLPRLESLCPPRGWTIVMSYTCSNVLCVSDVRPLCFQAPEDIH